MEKIRKKLLRKYASVFKRDLGKEDRIHMDPVKVELIDESRTMGNAIRYDSHRDAKALTRCRGRRS